MATLFLLASKHVEDPAQHHFWLEAKTSREHSMFVLVILFFWSFWRAPRLQTTKISKYGENMGSFFS